MMTRQQIRKELEVGTGRIWRELDQQYGLPVPTPRADRESVDNDFIDESGEVTCEAELDAVLIESRRIGLSRRRSQTPCGGFCSPGCVKRNTRASILRLAYYVG